MELMSLKMNKNAYSSLLTQTKQLLLVTGSGTKLEVRPDGREGIDRCESCKSYVDVFLWPITLHAFHPLSSHCSKRKVTQN